MVKIRTGSLIHKWTDIVNDSDFEKINSRYDAIMTYIAYPALMFFGRSLSLYLMGCIAVIVFGSFGHGFEFGFWNIMAVIAPLIATFLTFAEEIPAFKDGFKMELDK